MELSYLLTHEIGFSWKKRNMIFDLWLFSNNLPHWWQFYNFLHVDIYHNKCNTTQFCMLIHNVHMWYDHSVMNLIKYFTTKKTILQNSACWFLITYKYNFLLLICDMIVQTWTLSNTLPPKNATLQNSACWYMIWSFRHDPYQNVNT